MFSRLHAGWRHPTCQTAPPDEPEPAPTGLFLSLTAPFPWPFSVRQRHVLPVEAAEEWQTPNHLRATRLQTYTGLISANSYADSRSLFTFGVVSVSPVPWISILYFT